MAIVISCDFEIHVGDIGTIFEITLTDCEDIVDVSSANILELIFKLPDNAETILTKTATLVTDGTDGVISYTTIEGDLSISGKWKLQAQIGFPNSTSWKSDIASFKVYSNL